MGRRSSDSEHPCTRPLWAMLTRMVDGGRDTNARGRRGAEGRRPARRGRRRNAHHWRLNLAHLRLPRRLAAAWMPAHLRQPARSARGTRAPTARPMAAHGNALGTALTSEARPDGATSDIPVRTIDHRLAARGPPFQALGQDSAGSPGALPWAGWVCPIGAKNQPAKAHQ
jgi:hypothetical protein